MEAPRPEIGRGEPLVRIHAAGVNPPDLYLRDGYAQYVRVAASELARKPTGVDHVHAAGAPMSLLTAWQLLIELRRDAPNPFQSSPPAPTLLAGRNVAINGAGGGLDYLLVQLAKCRGAFVVAVASGKNEALMRKLGTDRFIDYRRVAVEQVIYGADSVIDAVGAQDMERLVGVVKPGGALFLVNPLGFGGYDAAKTRGVVVSSTQVRSNGRQLAEAGRLLDDGVIRVVLDSIYPLAESAWAHERAARGGVQGKIVLAVV